SVAELIEATENPPASNFAVSNAGEPVVRLFINDASPSRVAVPAKPSSNAVSTLAREKRLKAIVSAWALSGTELMGRYTGSNPSCPRDDALPHSSINPLAARHKLA